jgi:protoheme IX farnesyltransferase
MKAYFQLVRPRTALLPLIGHTIKVYFQLTKPRIALLLLISTAGGMLAAGGGSVSWGTGIAVLVGGYLCAGGAAAMNCYLDRELDLAMERTRNRPLPSGQVAPRNGLAFSIAISLLSVPLFLMVSPMILVLGIAAWTYYVLVYSVYLKRRTPQNIVIGGAAGAFPPLIGWTAVAGSIDLSAIFLFLTVFFWTPPHAYALMLVLKEDYRRARVPMLPVVKGDRETGRQIILYSVALLAVTVMPAALGLFGLLYLAAAIFLGVILLALAVKLYYSLERTWARRLFRYSSLYLALLFLVLVLDRSFMA